MEEQTTEPTVTLPLPQGSLPLTAHVSHLYSHAWSQYDDCQCFTWVSQLMVCLDFSQIIESEFQNSSVG